jgi:alkanesulfonate monooxygenase SsuD/methylene tetrahydromethanopterin reductase-like flavin-dependent oxidoreductase (luciferase family)
MAQLKIGVVISSGSPPDQVRPRARHAEAVGLDSIFSGDHLAAISPTLDSVVSLSTAAAVTERIEIGFGVMVLALRHVAWAAKQLATMQAMSGNRILLGVGSGGDIHGNSAWNAVGIPYAERGARTDEALALLPDLIAGKPTDIDGNPLTLAPGAQPPPILVGGGSPVALRRSAQYGDSWFPSVVTPAQVRAGATALAELADRYGRPTASITVGGAVGIGPTVTPSKVDAYVADIRDGYGIAADIAPQIPIAGSPAQVAERFAAFAEAGATHLVLGTFGDDWYEQVELLGEARRLATG